MAVVFMRLQTRISVVHVKITDGKGHLLNTTEFTFLT